MRILSRVKGVLSGVALVLICTYAAGVIGFHYVGGLDWLDAAYFTLVTLSTIGFGDITPKTACGKILVMAVAVFGVASFAFSDNVHRAVNGD